MRREGTGSFLGEDGSFSLSWTIDDVIRFVVEADATGYLSFGFQPYQMGNAKSHFDPDMIICWVDNGNCCFQV